MLGATAALTALAPAALAQQPSVPATAAPATAAPATDTQPFTDAELVGFAKAAIAASKVQQDAAVPAEAKQTKMLAAVQAEGLEPARFNAIAQASNSDPELKKRIETVASAALAAPAP
ncbi:MAG: hypothetical protein ABS86_05535 [Sphingobium sp. SCN 64-10]|nr:MAG: hypothetical protein ABS86_05535 [Sphingobium sp. SCN 64-10]